MILDIERLPRSLTVTWQDGASADFSYLWLRDNARDALSFDARSNQRELFTAGLPPDIQPASVRLDDAGGLLVEWPDVDEPVSYAASFLRHCLEQTSQFSLATTYRRLWSDKPSAIRLPYESLVGESPGPGASLGQAIAAEGFAIIDGCPLSGDSVQTIAGLLGYVRETIFGGIWEFEADEAMADSAYTPKELRPHTDGTYSLDAPGVQILLCLENRAQGAQSILVDGYHVAEQIRATSPEVFQDLARIEIEGCYQGDGVMLRAKRPAFRVSEGEVEQVTFNNYDRAPMCLPPDEMQKMYRGIRTADLLFNDPANQWRYTLQAGEALVFDNWRLLHGRSAFTGVRRMTGAYVNREDLLSFLGKVLQKSA